MYSRHINILSYYNLLYKTSVQNKLDSDQLLDNNHYHYNRMIQIHTYIFKSTYRKKQL